MAEILLQGQELVKQFPVQKAAPCPEEIMQEMQERMRQVP